MYFPLTNILFSWNQLLLMGLPILVIYFLKRPKGIPPGPWLTLPVLGDMLSMRGNILSIFEKMRKKHGDIFSFYMGNRLVIVISGYKHLHATFHKKGNFFKDKPNLVAGADFGKGIILANGESWREQRKFTVNALRNLGMGRNILEVRIKEEINILFDRISDYAEHGHAFDPQIFILNSIVNIIGAIIFGKRFELDDPKFLRFRALLEEGTETFPVVAFCPFLKYLPRCLSGEAKLLNFYKSSIAEIIKPSILEHVTDKNRRGNDNVPKNFVDEFLEEMNTQKKDKTNSFSDIDNLKATVFDLFAAGSSTVTTTLRWTLLYLMHFPQIQEKCFQQIEQIVGSKRTPSIQDKPNLPYVEATVQEVMRIAAVLPLPSPHGVSQDLQYNGYRFPKGVIVIPNLHSVLSDPDVWDDPESFKPERFLDHEGKVCRPKEFVPFMMGRRICPGELLAQMELFLFVSTLIQKYEIRQEEGEELPSLAGVVGVVHTPSPYKLLLVPRNRHL